MGCRTGNRDLGLRAGWALPVLLLAACTLGSDGERVGDPPDMADRIGALEVQHRQLEAQFKDLQKQLSESGKFVGQRRREAVSAVVPSEPLKIAGLPSLGAASATVVVVEYSDFQCPFCRRHFADTWPTIERQYVQTGKIRYIFQHFPLDRIHPVAVGAAEGAVCADRQGRFWEMHDRLFENPRALHKNALTEHAAALQLNIVDFTQCMTFDAPSQVESQIQGAKRSGVTSTPTFLIGRLGAAGEVRVLRRISGAQPFSVFKETIDQLLQPSSRPN